LKAIALLVLAGCSSAPAFVCHESDRAGTYNASYALVSGACPANFYDEARSLTGCTLQDAGWSADECTRTAVTTCGTETTTEQSPALLTGTITTPGPCVYSVAYARTP
jgi:hypothetical protein